MDGKVLEDYLKLKYEEEELPPFGSTTTWMNMRRIVSNKRRVVRKIWHRKLHILFVRYHMNHLRGG
jgi:hypothetical protein